MIRLTEYRDNQRKERSRPRKREFRERSMHSWNEPSMSTPRVVPKDPRQQRHSDQSTGHLHNERVSLDSDQRLVSLLKTLHGDLDRFAEKHAKYDSPVHDMILKRHSASKSDQQGIEKKRTRTVMTAMSTCSSGFPDTSSVFGLSITQEAERNALQLLEETSDDNLPINITEAAFSERRKKLQRQLSMKSNNNSERGWFKSLPHLLQKPAKAFSYLYRTMTCSSARIRPSEFELHALQTRRLSDFARHFDELEAIKAAQRQPAMKYTRPTTLSSPTSAQSETEKRNALLERVSTLEVINAELTKSQRMLLGLAECRKELELEFDRK